MTQDTHRDPKAILLPPGEWVPNNVRLPVLLYPNALSAQDDLAAEFERRFARNVWGDAWRGSVYGFHHYHTRGHEALGVAQGEARLLIGGPDGRTLEVRAGDCVVLPVGTGHCCVGASEDFLIVGAYPPGQEADIVTTPPTEAQLDAIRDLPLPEADPLDGSEGALMRLWQSGT